MIRYSRLFLICSFTLALNPQRALCWGDMGHQTVGEIAERYLTPNAKLAITDILGPEKLAIAAVWADSVRDDPDFDLFKPYHFIDIENDKTYETMPESEHEAKDSVTVLKNFPTILMNPEAPRSVKIVALKYLIHVVGDVHQPLHAGLKEDSGGNLCRVAWKPNEILNLHQIWDGKIIDYDIQILKAKSSPLKFYSFSNYADDIIKHHPLEAFDLPKLSTTNYFEWIKESQNLRSDVYPDNHPENYCQSKSIQIPELTDTYKIKSIAITENRLLAGGLRLAALLNQIFKDGSNPGKNISLTKEQVLKELNLSNHKENL